MSVTLLLSLSVSLSALAATPRAIVENITTLPFPLVLWINGFPNSPLNSMRSDLNNDMDGFKPPIERFNIIHPYFLKSGPNTAKVQYQFNSSFVAAEDKGPWQLRIDFARFLNVKQPNGRYDLQALGSVTAPPVTTQSEPSTSHTVTGRFTWTEPVPPWRWIHGVPIQNDAATRNSLYAEVVALRARLQSLYAPKSTTLSAAAKAFREEARSSTHEFIQASELYGKKFKYLDELVDMCRWRAMSAGWSPPKAGKPTKPLPGPLVAVQDGEPADVGTPLRTAPDGGLPPQMDLRELPPVADTQLQVFADGALAELTDRESQPLFIFDRNYKGGSWGSGNEPLNSFTAWYRKNAKGAWELDALVPRHLANMEVTSLSDLLEVQAY